MEGCLWALARCMLLNLVACLLAEAQPAQDDLGCGRSDELSRRSSEGANSTALGVCC